MNIKHLEQQTDECERRAVDAASGGSLGAANQAGLTCTLDAIGAMLADGMTVSAVRAEDVVRRMCTAAVLAIWAFRDQGGRIVFVDPPAKDSPRSPA